MIFKELIFNSFYFEKGVVVFKELIFNSFQILEGCGDLGRN